MTTSAAVGTREYRAIVARRYRAKNREKVNATVRARRATPEGRKKHNTASRQWYKANRHKALAWCRKNKYGLTVEAYDALVLEACGYCPLCLRQDDNTSARGLVVDHDHYSGRIRGLICGECNRVLSKAIDSGWFQRTSTYLTWA